MCDCEIPVGDPPAGRGWAIRQDDVDRSGRAARVANRQHGQTRRRAPEGAATTGGRPSPAAYCGVVAVVFWPLPAGAARMSLVVVAPLSTTLVWGEPAADRMPASGAPPAASTRPCWPGAGLRLAAEHRGERLGGGGRLLRARRAGLGRAQRIVGRDYQRRRARHRELVGRVAVAEAGGLRTCAGRKRPERPQHRHCADRLTHADPPKRPGRARTARAAPAAVRQW